ncbi:MAG: signal peptidase II [Dialister micraerophilus]|uniref:signal peptidase II n=1 Tax=Dialister micraerophilus TaxID=309120 RepID=UPI00254D7A8B|nr:signal peptidase II [Dialister micraerophilus]MDK8253568.1 signal peptidase II [Dialister micraerophilus]
MITVVVAFFIVIFDQLTKYLIQNFMQYGQTVPVIPDVFHLTYIINCGAAFGILPHKDWFFLSIVFILFCIFVIYRKRIPIKPIYFSIGIGLLLGGAFGNAIDRVRISGVVDFLDLRIWPIFNVADVAICIGVMFIVYYFWRHN